MSSPHVPHVTKPAELADVLTAELDQIARRRVSHGLSEPPPTATTRPSLPDLMTQARRQRLVGLAFSGGGIRSATFNVGLLQGQANLGLLKFIDYLSTV